ncbi:MAG: chloride channel protein [Ignavibacteriales bacterium]|nr:chloride channel protein [Ignavibacteriales bacterium]
MTRFAKLILIYIKKTINRITFLLKTKIEFKTFIVLGSVLVGILSGLAAVILKKLVHFFQQEPRILLDELGLKILLPFTPLIGILLSVLIVDLLFGGKIAKGLSHIIYIIIRRKSDIPRRDTISHLLTSGVTIGMGGSAGLEAPIVIIGAAIGSNFAKSFKLNYQTRTLLLACGSAAGISAIFNSPIAGVIFAFEVLLPEITVSSFIPLLIASASSAVLSKFLYSGQLFYLVTEGWQLYAIPYYIMLGILCGLISLYIIKTSFLMEARLEKFQKHYAKAVIGGLLLCGLIFLFPPLFGEGYTSVIKLLSGNHFSLLENSLFNEFINKDLSLIVFVALMIFTKVIATSLTISSGGNGGIFAPSLFIGALTGFFLAHSLRYFGVAELNSQNFIVVGMAGVLCGVLHAPLTGIFLIAEITGGYTLIVPLMIVTALSFFISKHFHPHSIYTTSLAKKGIKFRSEKEKYFIQQMSVSDLVESDFIIIKPGMTLRDLVEKIPLTKRNLFPVVDDEKKLIGVITLDDIREIMLDYEAYDIILVTDIMVSNFNAIDLNEDINRVIEIFEETQLWNLAVTNNDEYVGFISKSTIFNKYLSVWAKQQKESI